MYSKNWIIKTIPDESVVQHLVDVLGIDHTLAILLAQRGITDYENAKAFFRPSYDQLHSPFLMKDMQRAVDRINHAIRNRERIMVYGDYDVDGTTSVAMVYSFLKKQYPYVDYYIPDRYNEGYGISYQGIDTADTNRCKLIISLDCGIKAVDKINYASNKGIDFIICDHHYPDSVLPSAFAILNPKRAGCEYPYKELSGCGVGFKMLQAYAQVNKIPVEEVYEYIDLVAVSIASDIVPMDGENRVLAALGIQKLNENPTLGLKSIVKISGLDGSPRQVDDIVFKIGPRINAAGRMESGNSAVQLLISDDEKAAREFGNEIDKFNDDRRNVDSDITRQALRMLSIDPEQEYRKSTVLYNPSWHKGVVGIVASRLIETYYRPTVILTKSNDFATGSARSVDGFDLYSAIDACSDLLENFGGHMYAAGITLKIENVPEFSRRFEEIVASTITDNQLVPNVDIDAEINLTDITPKFIRILKQFKPFGPKNMTPVFLTRNISDLGNGKIVGKCGEHLRLDVLQKDMSDICFPAIGFQMAEHYNTVRSGIPFDICYTVEENTFKGKTTIQLHIKDIRPSSVKNSDLSDS
ncbi:MAG: single-stranded-DNA-specific exonuclease RecJ [Bacteroidales bacterium]|jgi:single-stranded-DNA-specific exonuclease|nr:single-stranded-DNA-specific exonuclease RecJ [Bacteroidales bacterium]